MEDLPHKWPYGPFSANIYSSVAVHLFNLNLGYAIVVKISSLGLNQPKLFGSVSVTCQPKSAFQFGNH